MQVLIEYVLLLAAGLLLFVGYLDVAIIFILVAIYLRLHDVGKKKPPG